MKTKIYNYDHLQEKDINHKIIRVKAILINDKKEVLIGISFHTPQFIGGHLKNKESLEEALVREIREESGIKLEGTFKPYFCIKYYLKKYPKVHLNTSLEIYYFYIPCNTNYNLKKLKLDEHEKKGDFKLEYVPLNDLKKYLKAREHLNSINKIINKEMFLALKNLE